MLVIIVNETKQETKYMLHYLISYFPLIILEIYFVLFILLSIFVDEVHLSRSVFIIIDSVNTETPNKICVCLTLKQ